MPGSLVHVGADFATVNETIILAATSEPRGDGEWRLTDLGSRILFRAEVPVTVMTGQFTVDGEDDDDPVLTPTTPLPPTNG